MKVEQGILVDVNNSDIVDGEFTIPDGVTSLGNYAFGWCNKLTSIIIPDSVSSIDNYAFYKCTGLTTITIPDSVTSIGVNAFAFCDKLTSLIIGNGVLRIGGGAFDGCRRLTSKKANYKAFLIKNGQLYCHNEKYREDVENSVRGTLVLCNNGIHYCTNLFEIFNYYYGEIDKDIAIYEIEVGDKVLKNDRDSKCCTNSCILKKRLYREDIMRVLNERS